jgi:D-alanine--poly(phosphoribitol) ligase subunit 2
MTDVKEAGVKETIHAKIVELASQLGRDAKKLKNDEVIPASGFLDSAALMELVMWFEFEHGLAIDQNEITLENFGTIDAMADYLKRQQGGSV